MQTKKYLLGDICVEVTFNYDYILAQCKDYETDKAPDFSFVVTAEDIRYEESFADKNCSKALLESMAFYRKFCNLAALNGVILMHGCAVSTGGKAYIFTAPSGTGKTTHAALWIKAFGDKVFILNGDKPLLRQKDGQFYVYGTPWNGKERLGVNQSLPLGGILKIERGEQNEITPLTLDEPLKVLLSQVYRPNDPMQLQAVLGEVVKLAAAPFYRLKCNISTEAAELSYKTLTEGL